MIIGNSLKREWLSYGPSPQMTLRLTDLRDELKLGFEHWVKEANKSLSQPEKRLPVPYRIMHEDMKARTAVSFQEPKLSEHLIKKLNNLMKRRELALRNFRELKDKLEPDSPVHQIGKDIKTVHFLASNYLYFLANREPKLGLELVQQTK